MRALRPIWCLSILLFTGGCELPRDRDEPEVSEAPDPTRFTRKVLVDGLDEPIQLEFDRAGRVYFIERTGAVKRYDESSGQVATLGKIPVAVVGEAGLIGLLLDRDFQRTRHFFVYYSSLSKPSEMRLSRFTLTPLDSIDSRSEIVMMRWPYEVASHFGGGMTWEIGRASCRERG